MKQKHVVNIEFLTYFILVYLAAWIVQNKVYFSWDVTQLIYETRSMLAGGKYITDFFTPNPPMIFYLYMPPIIFSDFFHLDINLIFLLYVFLIASISLFICFLLVRNIFLKQPTHISYVFSGALAILFLIMPFYHFGQRDHLLFILAMPYFLLATYRLQGGTIFQHYAIGIGLLAGIGFSIKPQFLIIPLLIELYYIFYQKNGLVWLRAEVLTIAIVWMIYVCILFAFYPNFVFVIMPYMMRSYYSAVGVPWISLILNPIAIFCWLPIVIYIAQYKTDANKTMNTILSIVLLGCLGSFFAQRTHFFYHIYPAFAMANLLLTLQFYLLLEKYRHVFILILGILFFTFPLLVMHNLYNYGSAVQKEVVDKLSAFIRLQPPQQSIYVFSEATDLSASLVNKTNAYIAQRFDCLWMVKNLLNQRQLQGDDALRQFIQNNHDKNFFINVIVEDLHDKKPNLVFVDVRKLNVNNKNKWMSFDYLNYFSENSQFRNEWKSYHYLKTIEGGHHLKYKLDVYRHI